MKTKLILEIGCNHNGEIGLAESMIDAAAALGVWGVKFQKRDIASIPPEVALKPRSLENSFGLTYGEHRAALEFSIKQIEGLKDRAEAKGLFFICSAFDLKSAQDLLDIECQYIKLPSQLFTDMEMFKLLAESPARIMVSTGMHTADEIISGPWTRNTATIFHCISSYPAKLDECQISIFKELPIFTGYSSHEIGGGAIPFAVAEGAEYIERHFTLDKNMKGSDHKISSDPEEVVKIMMMIGIAEKVMGSGERILSEDELKIRKIYRGF